MLFSCLCGFYKVGYTDSTTTNNVNYMVQNNPSQTSPVKRVSIDNLWKNPSGLDKASNRDLESVFNALFPDIDPSSLSAVSRVGFKLFDNRNRYFDQTWTNGGPNEALSVDPESLRAFLSRVRSQMFREYKDAALQFNILEVSDVRYDWGQHKELGKTWIKGLDIDNILEAPDKIPKDLQGFSFEVRPVLLPPENLDGRRSNATGFPFWAVGEPLEDDIRTISALGFEKYIENNQDDLLKRLDLDKVPLDMRKIGLAWYLTSPDGEVSYPVDSFLSWTDVPQAQKWVDEAPARKKWHLAKLGERAAANFIASIDQELGSVLVSAHFKDFENPLKDKAFKKSFKSLFGFEPSSDINEIFAQQKGMDEWMEGGSEFFQSVFLQSVTTLPFTNTGLDARSWMFIEKIRNTLAEKPWFDDEDFTLFVAGERKAVTSTFANQDNPNGLARYVSTLSSSERDTLVELLHWNGIKVPEIIEEIELRAESTRPRIDTFKPEDKTSDEWILNSGNLSVRQREIMEQRKRLMDALGVTERSLKKKKKRSSADAVSDLLYNAIMNADITHPREEMQKRTDAVLGGITQIKGDLSQKYLLGRRDRVREMSENQYRKWAPMLKTFGIRDYEIDIDSNALLSWLDMLSPNFEDPNEKPSYIKGWERVYKDSEKWAVEKDIFDNINQQVRIKQAKELASILTSLDAKLNRVLTSSAAAVAENARSESFFSAFNSKKKAEENQEAVADDWAEAFLDFQEHVITMFDQIDAQIKKDQTWLEFAENVRREHATPMESWKGWRLEQVEETTEIYRKMEAHARDPLSNPDISPLEKIVSAVSFPRIDIANEAVLDLTEQGGFLSTSMDEIRESVSLKESLRNKAFGFYYQSLGLFASLQGMKRITATMAMDKALVDTLNDATTSVVRSHVQRSAMNKEELRETMKKLMTSEDAFEQYQQNLKTMSEDLRRVSGSAQDIVQIVYDQAMESKNETREKITIEIENNIDANRVRAMQQEKVMVVDTPESSSSGGSTPPASP